MEGGVTGNVRDPEVRGGDVFLEEQQRQSGRVKWPPVPALTKDHKASGLTRHRAATLQSASRRVFLGWKSRWQQASVPSGGAGGCFLAFPSFQKVPRPVFSKPAAWHL